MSDDFFDGRRVRLLTLVDHFTRENLAIEVDGSLGGYRVVGVLARLALEGRVPNTIAVDNGPEFTSRALDQWVYLNGVCWTSVGQESPRTTPSSRLSMPGFARNA